MLVLKIAHIVNKSDAKLYIQGSKTHGFEGHQKIPKTKQEQEYDIFTSKFQYSE